MFDITIRTINVELTDAQKQQVYRQIGPLLRLMDSHRELRGDVIIRSIRKPISGECFCIMVRFQSPGQQYYAIGMAHTFMRAIREAEGEMRKAMIRLHTPDIKTVEHLRRHAHERLFADLFVS